MRRIWVSAVLLVCVGLSLASTQVDAQTITPNGSGVEAMFASQSDAFRDSDPPGIVWGAPAGLGLYPVNAVIPGLPTSPTPSIVPAPGNSFAGGGYTSLFSDNLGSNNYTSAQATIDDFVSATPAITSDVRIVFQNWRLEQAPLAPGYAYNQLNFGSNYLFTFNPGLGAAINPAIPLLLSGQTVGLGSYAQFDAVINMTGLR